MSVSVYWILFALCSVRVCVHVFVCSLRPSSAAWSGVQMAELGPAEGDIRCGPFLCPCFLSSLIFSSPLPPISFFSAGFHLPVTSQAAFLLSSPHLLRAILGRGEFSALYFFLPSVFMCLSGLSAAAIHGGFGMKCLLTEPCAPELR